MATSVHEPEETLVIDEISWPFFNYFSLLVLEWLFSRANLQIFAK